MLIKNIKYILSQSQPFRERFGNYLGLKLWLTSRKSYKLPKGSIFGIRIPGFRAITYLRAGTSDIGVFTQTICERESDIQLTFSPTLIVDAGANIGLTSIVLASRYPACQVIALEVDSSNFSLLCKNIAQYKNIIPIRKALWKDCGHVRIQNPDASSHAYRVIETSPDCSDAVPAISIDALLDQYDAKELSLLKLDIEGSEIEIFDDEFAAWINKTKVIAVELHDRIRPGCREALHKIIEKRPHSEYFQGEYRVVSFSYSNLQ